MNSAKFDSVLYKVEKQRPGEDFQRVNPVFTKAHRRWKWRVYNPRTNRYERNPLFLATTRRERRAETFKKAVANPVETP